MRTHRMLLALVAALTLFVCAGPLAADSLAKSSIEGSGNPETRELDLAEFNSINVGGAFELEITLGDAQQVTMTIDDNLWDNLETEVHGGTLEIGWDKSCNPDSDSKVVIVVRGTGSGENPRSGRSGDPRIPRRIF